MEPALFNILLQADYPSIINACQADPRFFKICRQPYFWQEKAILDFSINPVAFKSITSRDNKARYEYLMKIEKNEGLVNGAKEDKKKLVEYFLSLGADDYNGAMNFAAHGGHMDIVKLMLSLGAHDYNWAMRLASRGGHMDIVKLMLSLGANTYNSAMRLASRGGHIDIVKLMISLGANDYNGAMRLAAYGGHMDIVELLKQYTE